MTAGTALVTGGQDGPAGLLGAQSRTGAGRERVGVAQLAGSAASGRSTSLGGEGPTARLRRDGGRERRSLAVLLRPDLQPGSGHPVSALISARHTSMMSATPMRPASPATGR